MPKWIYRNPRSKAIQICLPRREMDRIVAPVSRRAVSAWSPRVTLEEEKLAFKIWRPIRWGATDRTTVSTSGSSGTLCKIVRRLRRRVAGQQVFYFQDKLGNPVR